MPLQVDTFMIHKNLHFQQISDLVGIPMEEIQQLNPQYIKDIIPGNTKPYVLRLPYTYSSAFIANEDSLYTHRAAELFNPQTLVSTKPSSDTESSGTRISYKVRSGDSLGKIAARHHVTVAQLKSWNHLKSNTIRVGQRLYIYRGGSAVSSSKPAAQTTSKAPAASSSGAVTYKVKKGDTLYKISKQFGVSSNAIMKYNGIGEKIREGQTIKIPPK
jgi:membrane-bound lytic murein transglycosylase D